MKTHILNTPIRDEDLEKIEIGDIVYLNGAPITARDQAHHSLVKLGRKLPVDLNRKAILHAGPIMVPAEDVKSGWKVASIGPTTSMRMELFEKEFIEETGVKLIIGKGGTEIEVLRQKIEAKLGKTVALNIVEVRSPDLNAQLVAENIAAQLEKRISFRRAMKQAIQRATRLGAKGIKCTCGGRLGGAEIARSESYHEGTIPLQTIRADIDYGFAEANTTYGRVGCKVWIYKGEVLNSTLRSENPEPARRERRDRRPNDRRNGDRRGNGERRPYNNDRRSYNGERRPYNNNNTEGGNR